MLNPAQAGVAGSPSRALARELPVLRLGRAPDNEIVLEAPGVSRYHASLTYTNGAQPTLTDLGSTNGTFVNGEPVLKAPPARQDIQPPPKTFDEGELYVFVSYARPDHAVAEKVEAFLTAAGVRVFRDTHIPPGANWDTDIEQALRKCQRMVLLLSSIASSSPAAAWITALP